jgi:hypothetical protein
VETILEKVGSERRCHLVMSAVSLSVAGLEKEEMPANRDLDRAGRVREAGSLIQESGGWERLLGWGAWNIVLLKKLRG